MNRLKAATIVAQVMTNRGFMNGWFGDDSKEFKDEQAQAIAKLPLGDADKVYTAKWWYELNKFNMTQYCKIPEHIQRAALGL